MSKRTGVLVSTIVVLAFVGARLPLTSVASGTSVSAAANLSDLKRVEELKMLVFGYRV